MSILFTTIWGALYLGVLLILMLPALRWPNKRWLAFAMLALFVCDRVAVNVLLPPEVALGYLAFAYMLFALGIVLTHRARVVGTALLFTSAALGFGALGLLDRDTVGTLQETAGLIAMISIVKRPRNGAGRHVSLDHRVAGVRRSGIVDAVPRRAAHK